MKHATSLDPAMFRVWDVAVLLICVWACAAFWNLPRERKVSEARGLSLFAAGLFAAAAGAASPLAVLALRGSHLAYMARLELLMNVAPVLLLLGLRSTGRLRIGLSPAVSRAAPGVGLGAWLLVAYASHVPVVHEVVMGSWAAYALQLLAFLVAGLLLWGVVLARGASATVLVCLVIAQAGAGVLAAVLIWSPAPLYGNGTGHETLPFGLSALADQRLAGAAMMVADMLVASTVVAWIFLRDLAAGRLRQRSRERSWRTT